jgi:ABC-type transport system substrate-binding protein
MDYFDASNMLSVYKGGGRHDWDNSQYDELLVKGGEAFNKSERQEIYTDAQVLLTSQAPAVFVWHGMSGYLQWPYLEGPTLAKNYLGYNGLQWPGFFPFSTYQEGLWVADNVGKYPRQGESGLL